MLDRGLIGQLSPDDQQIVGALRKARATSPARACPIREIQVALSPRFDALVHRGIVREASPGTFYLYEAALVTPAAASAAGPPWRQLLKGVVFWLIVLLIPVILLRFIR